ncbi:MAG: TIGR01777 family oxidoreductase [Gulosibacter sp.]|uniref:TIGR01777 family oxidoreductase n=1 Tax=Gulosibacter sp. TaxID=2817531 RepID=UPI003F913580
MAERKVVLAGGSGLIGTSLKQSLREDGFRVVQLVRRTPRGPDEVAWLREEDGPLDPAVLADAVAVVGLNGASIGKFPWTKSYRETLRSSRLEPTKALAAAIRELGANAPLFISASATGFYGVNPGVSVSESSVGGTDFLAKLCAEWEAAALTSGKDAQVALIRTAPVVHPEGVLKPMITLTKFGLAGPLAGGHQIWPWISLKDEVRAIRHIIDHKITGPVNLAGPTPASANGLGRSLAVGLRRPYAIPVPGFVLKAVLGSDAAKSLLLCDVVARPQVLLDSGFEFSHPTVRDAVVAALKRA